MTPWYAVSPVDRPSWTIPPLELANELLGRWPQAEFTEASVGEHGPEVELLLRHPGDPSRGIGVIPDPGGHSVVIDPADEPGMVAEFVAWYAGLIPEFVPEVRLFTEDAAVSLGLSGETGVEEVVRFLASLGRVDRDAQCPMIPE